MQLYDRIPEPARNWLQRAEHLFPGYFLDQGAWHTIYYPRAWTIQHQDEVLRFCAWTRLHILPQLPFVEREIVACQIAYWEFLVRDWRPWTTNPLWFNPLQGVERFLFFAPLPLPDKLKGYLAFLEELPLSIWALRNQVERPTQAATQMALRQVQGMCTALTDWQTHLLKQIHDARLQNRLIHYTSTAIATLKTWQATLERQLKEQRVWAPARLTEPIYRRLWQLWLDIPQSPEALLQEAEETRRHLLEEMHTLAQTIDPTVRTWEDVRQLLRRVARQLAYRPETFFAALRQGVETLRAFVRASGAFPPLDNLPTLRIEETPPYYRGTGAGASVHPPGAYTPNQPIFYYVDPLSELPEEERQSFLYEYHRYTLEILNIHEAMPGHYVQMGYALRHAPPLTTLFPNMVYAEGWAVYAEQLIEELGWNPDPLWKLVYRKWFLRIVTNAILDIRFHLEGLSARSADAMLREALQEEAERRAKWLRQQLSAVQLVSYFAGVRFVHSIRQQWLAQHASSQSDKKNQLAAFHHEFLRWGALSPRILRTCLGFSSAMTPQPDNSLQDEALQSASTRSAPTSKH